eukprot:5810532-Pyramimonas_sp.AAC.1
MLRRAIRSAQHSAPGPDALPYAAWAASSWGADILWDALGWVLKGQELFANTSDTIQIFLPKNVTDLELRDASCSRSPDKVRVLGLRNCDLKLISST